MKAIGEVMERNIKLIGADVLSQRGFVQIPIAIVRSRDLSRGAKMVYTALLSYAWHNDVCFPGQDRMAEDIGSSRWCVNLWLLGRDTKGFVKIIRRGQGKTNLYEVNLKAKVLKRQ
jgi:hypothetical protein